MTAGVTVSLRAAAAAVVPIGSDVAVGQSLPQAIRRVIEVVQPEKIILFGSYAYGTPTPDSDVDLLVVKAAPASRLERYSMVSEALWPRQFPVDIIVRTPEEMRQALEAGDPFVTEVVTRGQVVYERSR